MTPDGRLWTITPEERERFLDALHARPASVADYQRGARLTVRRPGEMDLLLIVDFAHPTGPYSITVDAHAADGVPQQRRGFDVDPF